MRTISSALDALLTSPSRADWVRVKVDNGTVHDLSNLAGGRDFLQSVNVSDHVDTPVRSARVELTREFYKFSLSPFMTGSPLNTPTPLLKVGNEITIEAAVVPSGETPSDADWQLQFEGVINRVEWGGEEPRATILARGKAGRIQSEFLEAQTIHGSNNPIETVIQDILDTHLEAPAVTLFTPVSPSFVITNRLRQKQPILHLIRTLALAIGWDVRYRWDNGTSSFRFTLFGPDRAIASPMRTFGPNDYTVLPNVAEGLENVRNAVQIVYTDAATSLRSTELEIDAASIAKYGRLWMEIAEDASSPIDTQPEAEAMALAALSDLKEPLIEQVASMRFFPATQLADYYRFSANEAHYDTDQDLAVVGYDHGWVGSRGPGTTLLALRGVPSTGVRRWLDVIVAPGVASGADFVAPGVPSNFIGAVDRGFFIKHSLRTEPDWDYTEVHIKGPTNDATFTPDANTLFAHTRGTRILVGDLRPDQRYLIRQIAVDRQGNKSSPSPAEARTTTSNTDSSQTLDISSEPARSTVPNSGFGHWQRGSTTRPLPFDRWEMTTGTWGTDADEETTIAESGVRSLRFKNTAVATTMEHDRIDAQEGRAYLVTISSRTDSAVDGPGVAVKWYNSAGGLVGTSVINAPAKPLAAANTWENLRDVVLAPASTRFAAIVLSKLANAYNVYFDNMLFDRARIKFSAHQDTAQLVPGGAVGTWTKVELDSEAFDEGGNFDPSAGNYNFTAPVKGTYWFAGTCELLNLNAQKQCDLSLHVNGTLRKWLGREISTAALQDIFLNSPYVALRLKKGDVVDLRVNHTDGPNRSTNPGEAIVYFDGWLSEES